MRSRPISMTLLSACILVLPNGVFGESYTEPDLQLILFSSLGANEGSAWIHFRDGQIAGGIPYSEMNCFGPPDAARCTLPNSLYSKHPDEALPSDSSDFIRIDDNSIGLRGAERILDTTRLSERAIAQSLYLRIDSVQGHEESVVLFKISIGYDRHRAGVLRTYAPSEVHIAKATLPWQLAGSRDLTIQDEAGNIYQLSEWNLWCIDGIGPFVKLSDGRELMGELLLKGFSRPTQQNQAVARIAALKLTSKVIRIEPTVTEGPTFTRCRTVPLESRWYRLTLQRTGRRLTIAKPYEVQWNFDFDR